MGVEKISEVLKILVAEDSAADRLILKTMLSRAGYDVVMAEDGQMAIEAFKEHNPDLVFMDVIMPNVGGIEATREIKRLSDELLIPIIFLTSLADAESLATCLDAGGDDFLSKPYNQTILESKIKSFARMSRMHKTMLHQRDLLEENHRHMIQEQTVAKQVFDKISNTGALNLELIRHYMSAMAVFNGDVLLAEVSPRGNLFVILGDFTGHGLPAAIGSMPLASTFYGMVSKGFSMSDILREINQKLYQTLPVGLFCCASCVDINFKRQRVSIWNGGLPDNILYSKKDNTYKRIPSGHLPLGVLPTRDFKVNVNSYSLEAGDRIFLWSDGIQEARSPAGDMFGEEGLNNILDQGNPADQVFDLILNSVNEFMDLSDRDDDISLVGIEIPGLEQGANIIPKSSQKNGYLDDWELSFTIVSSSLRTFNPLSMLIGILSEVPGLRQNSSMLYTVLSELLNNAIEHGVLKLSSDIKSSPSGFAEYYRLRQEGLENIEGASVRFDFKHEVQGDSGLLSITVTDSGDGFDFEQLTQDKAEQGSLKQYFGRGLTLIGSMCESLEVLPPGNKIKVQFRWVFEE